MVLADTGEASSLPAAIHSMPLAQSRTRRACSSSASGEAAREAAEGAEALRVASAARHLVVFSGAGLSCSAGLSSFSEPGGLYERARRRYQLDHGVRLFYASFFARSRRQCQAFLADVFEEASAARPTRAHAALAALHADGRLLRHVTLNIDGLHRHNLSLWSAEQPLGATMEMHGCVREAVCQACAAVVSMGHELAHAFRSGTQPRCTSATCAADAGALLRPRVLLYDDKEERLIVPLGFEAELARDLASADCVLWVGISFQQSASVEHFRRVRRMLQAAGHSDIAQVVVNPSADCKFNLASAVANASTLRLLGALSTADEFLGTLAGVHGSIPKRKRSARDGAACHQADDVPPLQQTDEDERAAI